MHRDARGIDLVVGAKGSPMQLILAGIFHIDAPTGNIPLPRSQALAKKPHGEAGDPARAWATARRATASSARTATTRSLRRRRLRDGRLWQKPMEAVLGARGRAAPPASASGGTFVGAHGLGGERAKSTATAYTVIGCSRQVRLAWLDRLVLTSIESVWQVHEQHQGRRTRGPQGDARRARSDGGAGAIPPRRWPPPRCRGRSTRRASCRPRRPRTRVRACCACWASASKRCGRSRAVLMLAAGLSVFIALWTAVRERRADLAMMRMLGALAAKTVRPADRARRFVLASRRRPRARARARVGSGAGGLAREPAQYPVSGLEWRPGEPGSRMPGRRGRRGPRAGLARLSHRCVAHASRG